MPSEPSAAEQGFVQIYTGNGKGKSTAAYGLALRAAGAGKHTLLIQMMKSSFPYSELESLKQLDELITVERYGDDDFVLEKRKPTETERQPGKDALNRAVEALRSCTFDMVILDEACVAAYFGFIEEAAMEPVFHARPDNVELVLTGRYCPESWLSRADLVTEMTEVKHYYTQGVLSRKGFDS